MHTHVVVHIQTHARTHTCAHMRTPPHTHVLSNFTLHFSHVVSPMVYFHTITTSTSTSISQCLGGPDLIREST